MYLHYVIDQRVAEHPVQVDALILQNVLEKQKKNLLTSTKNLVSALSFELPGASSAAKAGPGFILELNTSDKIRYIPHLFSGSQI